MRLHWRLQKRSNEDDARVKDKGKEESSAADNKRLNEREYEVKAMAVRVSWQRAGQIEWKPMGVWLSLGGH